jgi:hypothetical protein
VSLPDSTDQPRGVLVRKPRASIYTVLLLVALLALVFGCLIMVLELWRYEFQIKPPPIPGVSVAASVDRLVA